MSSELVHDLAAWRTAVSNGNLFIYNNPNIYEAKRRRDGLVGQGKHLDIDPFNYQYDLEVHLFLYYDEFWKGIPEEDRLPREEHFWRAAALRWPTILSPEGRHMGALCRNPWNEKVIWAMTKYKLIKLMGGSGQGKTRTPLAAMAMIWDHFIETPSGARMCVSSVDENKLARAAWSNLYDLYQASREGISKYSGRGIPTAEMKIKRPDMNGRTESGQKRMFSKDKKGIFEGILIGGSESQAHKRIDKLTGAHVPTALCFLLDEYQAMPTSPMNACFNLSTHPKFFWVFQAGNPVGYDDPLGQECMPRGGWDNVNVAFDMWESVDNYHRTGIVLHFDNERSPGVEDPIKYWYMPTDAKRDATYPTDIAKQSVDYFRFWKGWFPPDNMQSTVLNMKMLRTSGATSDPDIDYGYPILNAASFDSAPASHDRSQLTIFHRAVEKGTRRQIIWFSKTIEVPKTYAESYYRDTARFLVEIFRREGIKSGDIILDNTSSHGFGEELLRHGYNSIGVKYQSAATKELVDVNTEKLASEECINLITEAALVTDRFVVNGQVRGLTEHFADLPKELCTRRWKEGGSTRGKMQLEPKDDFKDRMGFSPDLLDTIFQACYFARHEWKMAPGAMEHQQVARQGVSSFKSPNSIYDNQICARW